jgi:hypothetical protein
MPAPAGAGGAAESPVSGRAWAPPTADAQVPAERAASNAGDRSTFAAAADRPEVVVGAAFAGGFVLAMILKRLAG